MNARIPAVVLGGTGYVAGELLRLLAAHPFLDLAAVASDSQPDEPVAQFFRHLQPVLPHMRFVGHDEAVEYVTANPVTAVFSAAPHGVSAALVDRLLEDNGKEIELQPMTKVPVLRDLMVDRSRMFRSLRRSRSKP